MTRPSMLPVYIERLTETGLSHPERMALIHEAAINAFGVSDNVFPWGFDAVVHKRDIWPLRRKMSRAECEAGEYWTLDFDDHVPARLWTKIGGETWRSLPKLKHKELGVMCVAPERVLELVPSSPDFPYLYEQRAALAEVLYYDKMTNEELRQFAAYVRM